MNTPPTKPPKRYRPKFTAAPDGAYTSGILNDEISLALGQLITNWPHVEEKMAGFFGYILGMSDKQSARLIFRIIINQNIRIAIMRSLLEKSPHHKDKDVFYDEIINEFAKLNSIRNKYVHGLWYTHDDSQSVFLEEETETYDRFLAKREVPLAELEEISKRISNLTGKLMDHRRSVLLTEPPASPQKHPQQPSDNIP